MKMQMEMRAPVRTPVRAPVRTPEESPGTRPLRRLEPDKICPSQKARVTRRIQKDLP